MSAIRDGHKIPDRMANAPELLPHLGLYYEAFEELTSCRQVGFGLGPIPWSAIQAWATAARLDDRQTADLHYHISRMDASFLQWKNKKDA